MAGLKFDRFLGLIPRTPAALLPGPNATVAENCDFAYGELRNARAGLLLRGMVADVSSVYTDDGVNFYTWSEDVDAVRSPLAHDQYDRLYYTTPTDFRVASRTGMTPNGGPPPLSYRVGVPRPAVAPVLSQASPIDLGAVSFTLSSFWEDRNTRDGKKYLEAVETPVTLLVAGSAWAVHQPNPYCHVLGPEHFVGVASFPAIGEEFSFDRLPHIYHDTVGKKFYRWSNSAHSYHEVAWNPASDPSTTIHTYNLKLLNVGGSVVLDVYTGGQFANPAVGWELAMSYEDTTFGPEAPFFVPSALDLTLRQLTPTDSTIETRVYVYTYVNIYDEESAPSAPATLRVPISARVKVGVQRDPLSADYAPIKKIRIYRTSGAATTDLFFAGEMLVLGLEGTSFNLIDSSSAATLNESLSTAFDIAPDPGLVGLIELPNGILMAFKDNELHFSDAYRPWSWPPAYVLTVSGRQIVGTIQIGTGALVTTTSRPYFVSGVSPDSMTQSEITADQAGVSKWALANVGDAIVYASHDGLVTVSGGQASMALSETHFTREVWRARYAAGLATMRFAVWDGRVIVYSSAAAFTPFMLAIDEAAGAMTDLPLFVARCDFVSPIADQCFYAVGAFLYAFAVGTPNPLAWQSREVVLPQPLNFGAAQVRCDGAWALELFAYEDGAMVLKHSESGLSGLVSFALPGGYLSDRYQFKISGTGVFRELRLATSMYELRDL